MFFAVQFPVVDLLLEPLRNGGKLVPVDQALLAGCGLSADVDIKSHCQASLLRLIYP